MSNYIYLFLHFFKGYPVTLSIPATSVSPKTLPGFSLRPLCDTAVLVEHVFETTGSNRAQTLPAFHEGAFLRRTFVDQVKTGTTNFLSNFKSVSNPPDRFNILRFCRIKLDLLPDLLNMHRNRSNISHRLHIPDFPE